MDRLSLGCLFSDRVEALVDGRVSIEGVDLDVRFLEAQRLFRATLREATFDLAELSAASHLAAIARGSREYVGLPIFLSRSFRHSNVYVRTDRIRSPDQLAGRRVGLIDWEQTAALWVRGLLADDFGVARSSVEWICAGLGSPVPDDRSPFTPPDGVTVRRSTSTLDAMLESGEIDAVISPTQPPCLIRGAAHVGPLWLDARPVETEYWRRTGCFPIMHLLVIRRRLGDADPSLPAKVAEAFGTALALARRDVAARDFPKIALPWLNSHAAGAWRDLGEDPWTYGIERNRPTLARLLRYAGQDGMVGDLSVEDAFR